jgi:hypothetical protein
MNHIDHIIEKSVIPWNLFTIQKNITIPIVYGHNSTFKTLRMTTSMTELQYPMDLFVEGKQHTIEFRRLHRCIWEDMLTLVYVPMVENEGKREMDKIAFEWRLILQTRSK